MRKGFETSEFFPRQPAAVVLTEQAQTTKQVPWKRSTELIAIQVANLCTKIDDLIRKLLGTYMVQRQ